MPSDDPTDRPLDEPQRGNRVGGLICMVLGLVGVFAMGLGFDLFGKPIRFDSVGPYLFYGSIWLGLFGCVWVYFRAFTAFRLTVLVSGVYLAIFVAGKLSRGEI